MMLVRSDQVITLIIILKVHKSWPILFVAIIRVSTFCKVEDDYGGSGNFGTDVEALFQAIWARAWYKGP